MAVNLLSGVTILIENKHLYHDYFKPNRIFPYAIYITKTI
jgi:hypothetical protein